MYSINTNDDVGDQWVAGTLFSRLDPPTRTALLRIAPARRFRKGDVLLAEGDRRGTHAFVLRAPSPDRSAVIARDNGESSVIYEAPGRPGWLVKLYRPGTDVDHVALDDLIAGRRGLSSPAREG
ncbi:hypothetical protein ACFHW2_14185 [Actinomadura sp. LOL_016]|uniref:hypothetical protein n=1 Tax=unclassified Actinomadura TaxID=2626254 RepID=UPI003A811567